MPNPRIYLAFANNLAVERFLPLLQEEKTAIYNALADGDKNSFYRLDHTELAKTDDICDYLIRNKDDVIIFHFGGHAEASKLMMSDEEADAQGIAQMLVQQTNIKLVFLNGCSTKKQVKFLLDNGIPAVIATATEIPDENAKIFAETFYKSLWRQYTLKDAFEMAAANLKSKRKGPEVAMYRDLVETKKEEKEADEFPWGLYSKKDDILKWTLPNEPIVEIKEVIIRDASDKFNYTSGPINQKLFDVFVKVLKPFEEELDIRLREDFRRDKQEIINAFPSPIAKQLMKLFAMNDPDTVSKERLQQLVTTYGILVDFLSFALLSNLWDFKTEDKTLKIPKKTLDEIKHFLLLGKEGVADYNNTNLLKSVLKAFMELNLHKKAKCFFKKDLPTLWKAFESDDTFNHSCLFMETMQKEMQEIDDKNEKEIESFCVQTEEHLGTIFQQLWLVAKYKLYTIKKINLRTTRDKDKKNKYLHHQVELYAITTDLFDDIKGYEGIHAANHSVILLQEEDKVETYLNFSPFIIDENALKEEKLFKLFLFNYYEDGEIHYKFTGDTSVSNELVLPYTKEPEYKEPFQDVEDQFDEFCNLFFGKPLKEL